MQLELIEGYDSMYTKPTRRPTNTDIHIAMTTVKNFLEQQYEQQPHISFLRIRTKNEDKMHQPGNAEALYPSLLNLGRRQRPREREERGDVFFFELCFLRHGWVSMTSR